MRYIHLTPFITVLAGLYMPHTLADAHGDSGEACGDEKPCVTSLPQITVTGYDIATGVQVIDHTLIEQLPTGEGNLADLLRINPAVDFSRNGRGSANSGIMRPEEFSFHGQPYYQNLFMIDGISVNNDINPASGSSDYGTPGLTKTTGGSSPQGYYLDVGLLEQVEVYDSNVPASFGGFTGGVVSAKMKRYDGNDFFDVRYGIQRDEWESFHIDEHDLEDFTNADSYTAEFTPVYRKDSYSLSAQQGLSERSGMTLGLSRRTSSFRQTEPDGDDTSFNDRIDNLHAHVDTRWNEQLVSGFSLRYANRRHDGITSPAYDDYFIKDHRGMGLGGNIEYRISGGHLLSLDMGLDRAEDILDSASATSVMDFSTNPRLSYGGFGDINQTQTSLTLAPKLELAPITQGNLEHRVTLGGELRHVQSSYSRPEDVNIIMNYANGTRRQMLYAKGDIDIDYLSQAVYVDDRIRWNNVNLRLGLRADYNDWLGNLDLAPRLSADWNLFGDDSTRLLVGANRYYGRSFLQYAVNDALNGLYSRINYAADGYVTSVIQGSDDSGQLDLNTPYSDELMLGWVQQAGPLNSTLKLVQRNSRDGVRKVEEGGLIYYDNSGSSETTSITWELDHADHPLLVGKSVTVARLALGWKDSTSNSQDSDGYDSEIETDPIFYKGRLIDSSELPAWDYNIPLSVSLSTITQMPAWSLTWSNFVNLRNGAAIARDTREDTANGYDIYEDTTLDDLITLDTKLQWKPRLWASHQGYLMVEVSNVFDEVISTKTSASGSVSDLYTPGRKIWLEVGMRF